MGLNKKAIIVLNKTNIKLSSLNSDINIGVEEGCVSIIEQNLDLNLAISDFDHINEKDINLVKEKAEELIILNKEKDNLDGECAILKAIEKGYLDITCVFEPNNRFDLNLSVISFIDKYNVKYLSRKTYMFLLNERNEFNKHDYNKYKYISIFPLSEIEISIAGLKYKCDKMKLKNFETMAFSNSFINDEIAFINIKGRAIIIFTND